MRQFLVSSRSGGCRFFGHHLHRGITALTTTLVAVLVSLGLSAPPVLADSSKPPNVVLVLADDMGFADVGVHGNSAIQTPHLDRFAKAGIDWTRFYTSPVCAPTRASLLTGRYYYRTGVIHTSRGGAKMHGDEITLAERLKSAGYRTGIFGKWHLGDNAPMRPQDQGFEECLVHKSGGIGQAPDQPNTYQNPWLWHNGERLQAQGYCTNVFFDAALNFIETNREQPFFVYLPLNAPHTPLEIADALVTPYRDRGLNDATAKVYAMITNLDDNFGRLIERLEALKLRQKTIVIFLGDNGPQQPRFNAGLKGRKSSVYEGGIRAVCFWQWPGRWRGGRKIDHFIAADLDVLPTLLDACGIPAAQEKPIDGKSLHSLLEESTNHWPVRTLYFQCHRGLEPHRYQNCAVMTPNYKLVGFPGTFSREDWDETRSPVWELYNLRSDPGEKNNLVATHQKVVKELQAKYETWFDDVRKSRNFTPGWIEVGSALENPSPLCRYQDAHFRDGKPQGWPVRVLRAGTYRVTVNRGALKGPGTLRIRWQNQQWNISLAADQNATTVPLRTGEGFLDVVFALNGKEPGVETENNPTGDVELLWEGAAD